MARPGTENHGTEKYWHGTARKILARKNIGTAWHEKSCQMDHFKPNSMIFEQIKIPKIIYLYFPISGK